MQRAENFALNSAAVPLRSDANAIRFRTPVVKRPPFCYNIDGIGPSFTWGASV